MMRRQNAEHSVALRRLERLEEEERQLVNALAVRYDEEVSRRLREVEIEIVRITGENTMDTGFTY
ncbi:MAG: hypothetical protein LBF62_05885 [Tannerellaceae bacterium]|jgi:hypothetical protein|nr:hypothetical protein [Tannerellaceae bacterium]